MAKNIAKIAITLLIVILIGYISIFGLSLTSLNIPIQFYSVMDKENGIRLGSDLSGGSVIVYEAVDAVPSEEQMSTVEDIMRKRLDRLGFSEATVAKQGSNRVIIEIPSITNPDEAIATLGKTAELKFMSSDGQVILTGKDVKDAKPQYAKLDANTPEQHYVELAFNADAQQAFFEGTTKASQMTANNQNFIAIMLDEEVYSQPRVSEPINSSTCVISGDFTAEAAKELATTIKEGQLPFKLEVTERRSSGPILGDNALKTSVDAGLIGLLIIMIFMIIVYRIPGFVSAISLIAYTFIVLLVMTATRANLSLPGIAGIVLSIGMAVDANVIIFERIKEELKMGKSTGAAVDAGFHKALSAILDANITTAIAAVVLYFFGTGPIRGFAITLGIGIIVSLFTAIFLTKFLLKATFGLNIKNPALYGISKKKDKKEDDANV